MRIDYDKDQLAYALANALKERDEAREKAERYRLDANALMLQRDEAREDLEHWKIEYEIVVSRLCGIKHERDNGIIAENEIIPTLRKERDEAMEDSLEQARLLGMGSEREAKLISERDEAREALMKIEHLFLESTDIYADFKNMGLIARAALEETK